MADRLTGMARLAVIVASLAPCAAAHGQQEPRAVSWEQIEPYVLAHVWPDPVRTPVDQEGEPVGRPRVTFHVCAGINGVARIEDPDPLLRRAGLRAVSGNATILRRASRHLLRLAASDRFAGLPDDAARTAFLRRELAARLASDPAVKPAACAQLAEHRAELGLVVRECKD